MRLARFLGPGSQPGSRSEAALPADALKALDQVSAPETNELDHFFGKVLQGMIHGGTQVTRTF